MIEFTEEEKERHLARSRKKYLMDHASDMATAKDNGIKEGIALMVRRLKEERAMSFEEIARISGFTIPEIEEL